MKLRQIRFVPSSEAALIPQPTGNPKSSTPSIVRSRTFSATIAETALPSARWLSIAKSRNTGRSDGVSVPLRFAGEVEHHRAVRIPGVAAQASIVEDEAGAKNPAATRLQSTRRRPESANLRFRT